MLLIVLFLKKKKTALEETNVLNVQSAQHTSDSKLQLCVFFTFLFLLNLLTKISQQLPLIVHLLKFTRKTRIADKTLIRSSESLTTT